MIAVPSAPTFIVALVAAACGAAAGYTWEHRARLAEVAQIRADIARREAEAAEESRRRIEAASRAMDAALAEKDRRVLELDATNRRLRHDLKTAATGRPCLSPAARGLLYNAPAFWRDESRHDLPSATGGSASTHAAPAADSGQSADSTDADIAGWIIDAAGLYEQCRARLDAIRQWDEVTHGR
jgi:hypothetical protein